MNSFYFFKQFPFFSFVNSNLEFPFHCHLPCTLRNLDLNAVSTVTSLRVIVALGIEFSSVYTSPWLSVPSTDHWLQILPVGIRDSPCLLTLPGKHCWEQECMVPQQGLCELRNPSLPYTGRRVRSLKYNVPFRSFCNLAELKVSCWVEGAPVSQSYQVDWISLISWVFQVDT